MERTRGTYLSYFEINCILKCTQDGPKGKTIENVKSDLTQIRILININMH